MSVAVKLPRSSRVPDLPYYNIGRSPGNKPLRTGGSNKKIITLVRGKWLGRCKNGNENPTPPIQLKRLSKVISVEFILHKSTSFQNENGELGQKGEKLNFL
jgi:hypothetical protein